MRESISHLYDKGIYCHGLAYPAVSEGEAPREVAWFAVDALDALSGL